MHIAAAAWIKRIPEGRGDGDLDAGCKLALQAWWDHVLWGHTASTVGKLSPNASYATIAEETGTKPATVEDRTRKLISLGWARRDADGRLDLAWEVPFAVHGPLCARLIQPSDSKQTAAKGSDSGQAGDRLGSGRGPTRVRQGTDSGQAKLRGERTSEKSQVTKDRAGARDDTPQGHLFGEPDPPKPERKPDNVARVIAYFNAMFADTREWAGLPPSSGIEVIEAHRKPIADRLLEVRGDDEQRYEACRRVIDVQAFEARSAGRWDGTPENRKYLREHGGWKYFKISTMFRNAKNFNSRLERWSEDGDHEIWGQPRGRGSQGPPSPRPADDGPKFTRWKDIGL